MKDKKNIDRIFQEKFKDFEAMPNPKVWENIQNELQGAKKVVPLIPLWLKLSGVAAILAILLLVGKSWVLDNTSQNVVHSTESVQPAKPTSQKRSSSSAKSTQNTKYTTTQERDSDLKPHTENRKISELAEERGEKNLIAETEKARSQEEVSTPRKQEENITNGKEQKADNSKDHNLIAQEDSPQKEATEKQNIKTIDKPSLFDEIARQEQLKEDENQKKEKSTKQRFSIQPNAAPIYYSSIGGGSALDPAFANNPTKGQVTASYGVNVDYKVSKHIRVRSGINKVNLQYNTPDIAYLAHQPQMGIRALNAKDTRIQDVAVVSTFSKKSNTQSQPSNSPVEGASPLTTTSAYTDGELNQELSYIEIPVEMAYTVLDERFGIHLIGGTSALILNNDHIQIQSAVETRELGRAENVNSLSFTGNIGIGFSYSLTSFLDFNVEPTFKYQFNGFKGKTGDFKPYFLGLYSGVSFRF